MDLRKTMFDEFFQNQLPEEGFSLDELYNDYFGLINEMNTYHPELHGYVVGMNGEVYVPEFRPRVSMDNRVKPN